MLEMIFNGWKKGCSKVIAELWIASNDHDDKQQETESSERKASRIWHTLPQEVIPQQTYYASRLSSYLGSDKLGH